MALVKGVNAGFVTTAPTADPLGTASLIEFNSIGILDTTPAGAAKVTEIGFWSAISGFDPKDNSLEVGIYTDSGSGYPDTLVGISTGHTVLSSDFNKWVRVTGLNISINPETNYWIAVWVEFVSNADVRSDIANLGGTGRSLINTNSGLDDPWGSTNTGNDYYAFYAVTEEAPTGFTRKIKISGTFQDKPIQTKVSGTFVDKITKIKVGGTFQDA